MDYNHYETNDFVADSYFNRWVKYPDKETNAFWQKWLEERPDKADILAEARSIVAFLNFSVEKASLEEQQEVKAKVMKQLRAGNPSGHQLNVTQRYLAMAATVSLLLIGAYLLWQFVLTQPYQTYTTGFGEWQSIRLPDSTVVKLNANSQLKYKKDWLAHQAREVWLEGEAFFEVVKKPHASDGRFIVHTQQLDVEVLGTTFNVQARHGETQVVLNTGKVKLHQTDPAYDQQDILLEPGEMATVRQHQLVKTQVNPQVYTSWKDNRLFFENESIRNVARRLEDLYGYEVKVAQPEWLDYTFTGSCPSDDISILLTAISESFHLKITLDDQQIRIEQHDNY